MATKESSLAEEAEEETSSTVLKIKTECVLSKDDTFYPEDFGMAIEEEGEIAVHIPHPVYVKMQAQNKATGTAESTIRDMKQAPSKGNAVEVGEDADTDDENDEDEEESDMDEEDGEEEEDEDDDMEEDDTDDDDDDDEDEDEEDEEEEEEPVGDDRESNKGVEGGQSIAEPPRKPFFSKEDVKEAMRAFIQNQEVQACNNPKLTNQGDSPDIQQEDLPEDEEIGEHSYFPLGNDGFAASYEMIAELRRSCGQEGQDEGNTLGNTLRKDFEQGAREEGDGEGETGNVRKISWVCPVCTRSFITEMDMVLHFKELHEVVPSQAFICPVCDRTCKNLPALKLHMRVTHSNELPFQCRHCSDRFEREEQLKSHLPTHSGNKLLVCDICGEGFSRYSDRKAHTFTHSEYKTVGIMRNPEGRSRPLPKDKSEPRPKPKLRSAFFECKECSKTFQSNGVYQRHIEAHRGIKQYYCDVCYNSFVSSPALVMHRKSHKGEMLYKCGICQLRFPSSQELSIHTNFHPGEKAYSCDLCEETFASCIEIVEHKTSQHAGEQLYRCNVCSRAFSMPGKLEQHKRRHKGEKPFKCDLCTKSFMIKSYLVSHMKVHEGARDHVCPICKKGFLRIDNLRRHVKTVHKSPFVCEVCEKPCVNQRHIDNHRRSHMGEDVNVCDRCGEDFGSKQELFHHVDTVHSPYRCSHCKKGFHKKKNLVSHLKKKHEVDAPLCNVCGFRCVNQLHLINHKMIHTGTKVHVCDYCGEGFGNKTHHLAHVGAKHTGQKPHYCDVCKMGFDEAYELLDHKRTHVTEEKSLIVGEACI